MEENNKMDISRRGFLKTAALAGAAMAMPSGLGKVFASEAKQAETSDVDTDAARIKGHRVLGTGKAAFEVSALGFGVMGMTYNRSQHPDKKECIRLLHEAVDRGVTLFDTAIIYGPLTNENLAGEALSEFKGRINVTTKFGHEVIDGKGTGRQDSRPATIRRYCGGSWLVASESTVDRTDSGNDKTVSSGGKPAHTRLQHQLRGLERAGGYRGCYSRCGRPVQCGTATSGRPIRNQ